ncbi:hypothetical protein GCM10010424_05530 [Streptomyces lienomycini]
MHAGATGRTQYLDRVFDEWASTVFEQGLGAAAEPPAAPGGEQQSRHRASHLAFCLVFVVGHASCIPDGVPNAPACAGFPEAEFRSAWWRVPHGVAFTGPRTTGWGA